MKALSNLISSLWILALPTMLGVALPVAASGITGLCYDSPEHTRVSVSYDGARSPVLDYDSASTLYATKSDKQISEAGHVLARFAKFLAAKNVKAPNLTPLGAGRTGALREALRRNGVPTSKQPDRVLPNLDKRGNIRPGRVYEYDVPAQGGGTRTVRIRDDAGGDYYGPGVPQNRGPHFNDEAEGHYDY